MACIFNLIVTILFFSNSYLNVEIHTSKLDSLIENSILKDSIRMADSVRIFNEQKERTLIKKSIFGGLATLSAIQALRNGIEADGYAMVFYSIVAILSSIFVFRKNKPKSYNFYKKRESISFRSQKFNKAWKFTSWLGFIGFLASSLLLLTSSYFFALILYVTIPASIILFFLGFLGKYETKEMFLKKLIGALFCIFLPALPFLIFFGVFYR